MVSPPGRPPPSSWSTEGPTFLHTYSQPLTHTPLSSLWAAVADLCLAFFLRLALDASFARLRLDLEYFLVGVVRGVWLSALSEVVVGESGEGVMVLV